MKYILIILTILSIMSATVSCQKKPSLSLETAKYPIVISDITLKNGNTSRSMDFTTADGKFFSVSGCDVIDYMIKHNAIGDTIKTPMVSTFVEEEELTKEAPDPEEEELIEEEEEF